MRGCSQAIEMLKALCEKFPHADFWDVMSRGIDYDWLLYTNRDGKLWLHRLSLYAAKIGEEYIDEDTCACGYAKDDEFVDINDLDLPK
jgi:hypothetical protein